MNIPFAMSRRSLLSGLAVATATATTNAQAADAAENPRLIELGDQLPELSDTLNAALARRQAARKVGSAVWPSVPASIAENAPSSFPTALSIERNIAGFAVPSVDGLQPSVKSAKWLGRLVSSQKKSLAEETKPEKVARHKVRLKKLRSELRDAKKYEADCKRIRIESGYAAANDDVRAARIALQEHISAIMDEKAETITGVLIMAQALHAWSSVDRFWRISNLDAPQWMDAFAAAVIGVAEGRTA